HVKEGETAAVNSVVALIGEAGEEPASADAGAARSAVSTRPAAASPSTAPAARAGDSAHALTATAGRRPKSAPLVRRAAYEHNTDIPKIPGTGLEGRVTKEDITRYIGKPGLIAKAPVASGVGDRVEPMSVMRKKIAEHMIMSRRTSAHVHSIFHV